MSMIFDDLDTEILLLRSLKPGNNLCSYRGDSLSTTVQTLQAISHVDIVLMDNEICINNHGEEINLLDLRTYKKNPSVL